MKLDPRNRAMNPTIRPHAFRAGVTLLSLVLSVAHAAPARSQDNALLGGQVAASRLSASELKAQIENTEKLLAASPKNYRLHYELGNLYAQTEFQDKAIDAYEAALALNPKFIEAMVNLGSVYIDFDNERAID